MAVFVISVVKLSRIVLLVFCDWMYKIVCSPHRGPWSQYCFSQLLLLDGFTGMEKGGLTQVKK